MYYNYVINNSRRTVTIREYDDSGNRVATYRSFPFSRAVWDDFRNSIMHGDNSQSVLNSIVYGKFCRKIR